MRRGLFAVAATVSFAMFVMTCALWSRSYAVRDERELTASLPHPQRYYVLSQFGGVVVNATPDWPAGEAVDGETPWPSCRLTETWDRPFPQQNGCRRLGKFRIMNGDDEFFGGAETL